MILIDVEYFIGLQKIAFFYHQRRKGNFKVATQTQFLYAFGIYW